MLDDGASSSSFYDYGRPDISYLHGAFYEARSGGPVFGGAAAYLYDSVMGRFHFRKVQAIFSEARKIMMKMCR